VYIHRPHLGIAILDLQKREQAGKGQAGGGGNIMKFPAGGDDSLNVKPWGRIIAARLNNYENSPSNNATLY